MRHRQADFLAYEEPKTRSNSVEAPSHALKFSVSSVLPHNKQFTQRKVYNEERQPSVVLTTELSAMAEDAD